MSTTHSYSPVLLALLMMFLLLIFPLVYAPQSFRFGMVVKVLSWGMVVMVLLVWLAPLFRGLEKLL